MGDRSGTSWGRRERLVEMTRQARGAGTWVPQRTAVSPDGTDAEPTRDVAIEVLSLYRHWQRFCATTRPRRSAAPRLDLALDDSPHPPTDAFMWQTQGESADTVLVRAPVGDEDQRFYRCHARSGVCTITNRTG